MSAKRQRTRTCIFVQNKSFIFLKRKKRKKKKGGILTSTRHMVLPRASPCGDFSLHFVVSVKFGETDRWNSKKMSFEVHICGIWGGGFPDANERTTFYLLYF